MQPNRTSKATSLRARPHSNSNERSHSATVTFDMSSHSQEPATSNTFSTSQSQSHSNNSQSSPPPTHSVSQKQQLSTPYSSSQLKATGFSDNLVKQPQLDTPQLEQPQLETSQLETHQLGNNQLEHSQLDNLQLDMDPPPSPKMISLREMSSHNNKLAHLRVGLQASKDTLPVWQYGLIDSGCSDNLISIKALQAINDFDKAVINTSTATTIRVANNDQSQQVHGSVTLYLSVMNAENNERLTFKALFFVVSGLVFEIFIGQPFLTSNHISHETRDALYFHPQDNGITTLSDPPLPVQDPAFFKVYKSYNMKRKAAANKRTVLKPKTASKISTNLIKFANLDHDSFPVFRPCEQFTKRFPHLHIMHQSVFPNPDTHEYEVTILNTSDMPVTIKRTSHLGFVETQQKTGIMIHQLSDFVPQIQKDQDEPSSPVRNISLNRIVLNTHSTSVPLDHSFHDDMALSSKVNNPSCNIAYTSSMPPHVLTKEELSERKAQLKTDGYYQKAVSELITESQNIPSFDYNGDKQFEPKSDSELLSECNLDHLTPDQQKMTKEMLTRNIDAFQRHPLDIGTCKNITAFAPLTTDNPPILYAKYVPIPLKYKEAAQKLIDEYCRAGVLAPTCEPCTFTSNIFIIPKKDNTFRLIFDGRILSKYCQALPLALGNFDEIFADLTGKTFVSKLDVSKAYDQISVTPATSKLLSFFGPDAKRYVYLKAGQGLKFSSYFLTQAMDTILFGLQDVRSYCDDIFCATNSTFEEHLQLLETVIKRFQSYNVKLNIAKLEVAPAQLDFLGLTWSKDKLSIPKSKITAYLNLKKPKNLKEARFIVNSMAFYRRFIPRFSDIISPILDLLKEPSKKFTWTSVHQAAVDKLIATIENGVSLYLPRKDRPYIIHSDASYIACASTVSQYDDDGHLRLIAAVSRTFIKSERNLAPVQKEILSLLYTFTSLQYLLKGSQLTVYADAKSVTLLKTCSTSSPYLARLAMELSQYNFELYHLEGRLNLEADALSRLTKTQDKILSQDKLRNDSMTRNESLHFLEYLHIPNNYRFTVSEVRHMLTSEPLKSELKAKIKARHPGLLKSDQDNSPKPMTSKKTHEPRYVRNHPLERNERPKSYTADLHEPLASPLSDTVMNVQPSQCIDPTVPQTPAAHQPSPPVISDTADLHEPLARTAAHQPSPQVIKTSETVKNDQPFRHLDSTVPSGVAQSSTILLVDYLKTLPPEVLYPPTPEYDSDEFDSPWPSEEDTDSEEESDFLPPMTNCSAPTCLIHNFKPPGFDASRVSSSLPPRPLPTEDGPPPSEDIPPRSEDIPPRSEDIHQANTCLSSEQALTSTNHSPLIPSRLFEPLVQPTSLHAPIFINRPDQLSPVPLYNHGNPNPIRPQISPCTSFAPKLENLSVFSSFPSNPSLDLIPNEPNLFSLPDTLFSSQCQLATANDTIFNPASTIICLNNAVGINNVQLDETLQDLSVKTKLVSSGIISTSEFKQAQELDTKIVPLREQYDRTKPKNVTSQRRHSAQKGQRHVFAHFATMPRKVSVQLSSFSCFIWSQISRFDLQRHPNSIFRIRS